MPAGWYGFVEAAGAGIVRRAGLDREAGLAALENLASPELDSRTPDHDGRRMVRVAGGFVVLNYMKYRDKDHTSAERSRRYREKKRREAGEAPPEPTPSRVPPSRHAVTPRSVTQAEAEADPKAESEAEAEANPAPARPRSVPTFSETRTLPATIDSVAIDLTLGVDPRAERIRAVLADTRAQAIGLATPAYAAELLGSLGPLAYHVDGDALEVGLREAIADIPGDAPEAFWRKMLRTYVKQLAKKPPGEREHAKRPKPRRARRGKSTGPESAAALMTPAKIAELAGKAAGAVKGDA